MAKLNTRSVRVPEIDDYAYIMSNDGLTDGKSESQDITVIPETSRTINFTSSQTAAQIQADIDAVGRHIGKSTTITFQFANGTYSLDNQLSFAGFYGGGQMYIQGDTSQTDGLHTNHNVHLDFTGATIFPAAMNIDGCSISMVFFRHLKITADDGEICVNTSFEVSSRVFYNYFLNNAKTSSATIGFRAFQGCTAWLENNYVSNNHYAISANINCKIYSSNNDETGTDPNYGLHSSNNSVVSKNGTQPTGSTANEILNTGSEIR